jgi:hypothetical protein
MKILIKNKFYVYELIDPTTKLPFYVGKGHGKRMYVHVEKTKRGKFRNLELFKVIKNILNSGQDLVYNKVIKNVSNQVASDKEIELIRIYGKRVNGGLLVNITDGGGGFNNNHSQATKEKLRQKMLGRKLTQSCKNNIGFTLRHSKIFHRKLRSKKYRQHLSHSLQGRQFSDEHKQHISDVVQKQDIVEYKCERCNRTFNGQLAFGKHKKSCNDKVSENIKKIIDLYQMGNSLNDIKSMGYKSCLIRKSIYNIARHNGTFKNFHLSHT